MKFQFILLLILILSGCYKVASYRGDGKLIDNGWGLITNRYFLELGEFDLAIASSHRFQASYLPVREFSLGIIINIEGCKEPISDTDIQLQLIDEQGNYVINERIPISELTWGHNLHECRTMRGHIRGGYIERKMANNTVCNKPIYTGADRGNGTSFVPRSEGKYKVIVNVWPSETQKSLIAKLTLTDGGSPLSLENQC